MTHPETPQPRTAIVTGASSGIGLGLVRALLDHGYRVVGNSRSISSAGTLIPHEELALVDGDIADPATAEKVVRTAVDFFGSVDLLVNNAGIFIPKPFTDYTDGEFGSLLSTNVHGFFHVTQHAVRQMKRQRSGHIVNITTSLAEQPLAEVPSAIPALTKGGLNAITRSLAIELAGECIRVNAVSPGIIDTPMHAPETHEFLRTLHPIPRLGTVEEIAEAILYLDGAAFVTGERLHVDGGAHAGRW